jgi:hypothetical protein
MSLLLVIIIWQASLPLKWRAVIGWQALSAINFLDNQKWNISFLAYIKLLI